MTREVAVADAILCVSESTRQDLLRYYEVDAQRAVTIHSGVRVVTGDPASQEAGEVARLHTLPHKYLLFVSTIEPRKNLEVLLDAFDSLRARGAYDGSLVVAGRIGWKSEKLVTRLRKPGVVHLDYVHASSLPSVYKAADMFVFPSIYEGFGFPLLEAMALGVPTIAARSSSLPEIGGDAALYFAPHSARELEQAIERVAGDPELRSHMIDRGMAQAAKFRWSDAAAKTLAVLRTAAA